jgi:hypothetical protein
MSGMSDLPQCTDQEFEQRIRRALKTPPISNEEIERRSRESQRAKKQNNSRQH